MVAFLRNPLGVLRPAAAAALVAFAFALARPALAQPIPTLTGRVVDAANVLPEEAERKLADLSEAHERRTGNQIVVATVPSLDGRAIEEYALALGRAWKLGEKDKNDGVLLLIAPNEREVRIEVGYGLEGDLPDAVAKLIIESSIVPRFRAGDLPGGAERGVEDIIAVLDGDAKAYAEQARSRLQQDAGVAFIVFLFILMIFLFLLLGGGGGTPGYRGPIVYGGSGRSWSGGGSGGGFSGGGGSFGGGGATGRW